MVIAAVGQITVKVIIKVAMAKIDHVYKILPPIERGRGLTCPM
jgi:hypothetical protein